VTCPACLRAAGLVHASWLNQVEVYLSVIQRKLLTSIGASGATTCTHRTRRPHNPDELAGATTSSVLSEFKWFLSELTWQARSEGVNVEKNGQRCSRSFRISLIRNIRTSRGMCVYDFQ
jgi:hypothetical protein